MVDCQSTLTDDQWESLKQISIHVDELSFKTMAESFETLTNDIRKTNVPMNRQDNIDRSQWLKEFEKQTYAHYQGGGKSQQSEAVIPDWIEWTLVTSDDCHLMYLGRDYWLMDKVSVQSGLPRMVGSPAYEYKAIPILIATNPAWELAKPAGDWVIGDRITIDASSNSNGYAPLNQFAMLGTVGDYIHHGVDEVDYTLNAPDTGYWPQPLLTAGFFAQNTLLKELLVDDADPALVESFIPTFKDKRAVLTIDKCKGQFPLYHDEIRCVKCNGRVLLKLPAGNKIIKAKCPHSLASFKKRNQHDIHFPHLSPNLQVVGDIGLDSPTEMN